MIYWKFPFILASAQIVMLLDMGSGKAFGEGELSLEDLHAHVSCYQHIKKRSGKQELFENIINQYI